MSTSSHTHSDFNSTQSDVESMADAALSALSDDGDDYAEDDFDSSHGGGNSPQSAAPLSKPVSPKALSSLSPLNRSSSFQTTGAFIPVQAPLSPMSDASSLSSQQFSPVNRSMTAASAHPPLNALVVGGGGAKTPLSSLTPLGRPRTVAASSSNDEHKEHDNATTPVENSTQFSHHMQQPSKSSRAQSAHHSSTSSTARQQMNHAAAQNKRSSIHQSSPAKSLQQHSSIDSLGEHKTKSSSTVSNGQSMMSPLKLHQQTTLKQEQIRLKNRALLEARHKAELDALAASEAAEKSASEAHMRARLSKALEQSHTFGKMNTEQKIRQISAQAARERRQADIAWRAKVKEMKERVQSRPLLIETYNGAADRVTARKKALLAIKESLQRAGVKDMHKFFDAEELHDLGITL